MTTNLSDNHVEERFLLFDRKLNIPIEKRMILGYSLSSKKLLDKRMNEYGIGMMSVFMKFLFKIKFTDLGNIDDSNP